MKYIIYSIIIALAVFTIIMIFIPSTDDFAIDNPLWNGLSMFTEMFKVKPITINQVNNLNPQKTIVFVIGPSLSFTKTEALSLLKYVHRGGILVIADDYGSGTTLLYYMNLNVKINKYLITDPLFKYKSMYMPQVKIKYKGKEFEVYFNYGSTISIGSKVVSLGNSSLFSYIDLNLNKAHDPEEPYGPFNVACLVNVGHGKVIVISDSSIFINSMITVGDNANFIKALISDKEAYVITNKWTLGPYTIMRKTIFTHIYLVFFTSLRYPTIILIGLLMYLFGKKIHVGFIQRKIAHRINLKELVEEVLRKHPNWNPHILHRLAREVYSHEGTSGKD